MANPFEFVARSKLGSNSLDGYVYYQVLTFISSNQGFLPTCQLMNSLSFSRLDDEIKARVTNEIIRTYNKAQFIYPKQAKKIKDVDNEDLVAISKYLRCSLREARLYYDGGYISDADVKKFKEIYD